MIRTTARSCETCWFYRELKENFGVCRKNSPKPESIIDPDEEGHGVIAMWPAGHAGRLVWRSPPRNRERRMKPWIYIASPYTRGDQAQNVAFQMRIWDILAGSGVVTPIAPLWTHFQHVYRARPYEAWVEYDNEIIERCDACLRLDARNASCGYHQHESSGADGEVETFIRLGRPVFYDVEESLQWARQFRSSSILRCGQRCGTAGKPPTAGTG